MTKIKGVVGSDFYANQFDVSFRTPNDGAVSSKSDRRRWRPQTDGTDVVIVACSSVTDNNSNSVVSPLVCAADDFFQVKSPKQF